MNHVKYGTSGSGALSLTVPVPCDVWRVASVSLHLAGDPGMSDILTISLDAEEGAAYDAVLDTKEMNGSTDYVWPPPEELHLLFGGEHMYPGDKLVVAFQNNATQAAGVRVILQRVGRRNA